jgi:hypothetical protein
MDGGAGSGTVCATVRRAEGVERHMGVESKATGSVERADRGERALREERCLEATFAPVEADLGFRASRTDARHEGDARNGAVRAGFVGTYTFRLHERG